MQRCLELAALGRGRVAPNPMVGALLLYEDRIIGEGYHRGFGRAHAEIEAIATVSGQDKHLIAQSTLYVNLEPCSHQGKTPPCAREIVRLGIPRVVIGMTDPNPQVSGKGIAMLREAGVQIKEDVLHRQCRNLNRAFITQMEKGRPWILLKWAQSADGFIAAQGGKPARLTGSWANRMVHEWRADCAAILVGARTIIMDDPLLTPRLAPAYRSGSALRPPVRIVLDRYGELPQDARVLNNDAPTLLVRPPELPPERYLLPGVEILALQQDRQMLPKLLRILVEKGINSLMVEGGAMTHKAFIEAGLWDEARIFSTQHRLGSGVSAVPAPGLLQERTALPSEHGRDELEIRVQDRESPEP